jgi:hypothetical protein
MEMVGMHLPHGRETSDALKKLFSLSEVITLYPSSTNHPSHSITHPPLLPPLLVRHNIYTH